MNNGKQIFLKILGQCFNNLVMIMNNYLRAKLNICLKLNHYIISANQSFLRLWIHDKNISQKSKLDKIRNSNNESYTVKAG